MRSHAKASSAGSTEGRAGGLGQFFRGAFVTRGVASESPGVGAPSRHRRIAALSVAVALVVALLAVASASASKGLIDFLGPGTGEGGLGGQFDDPTGVAVNSTGTGVPTGTTYVADTENNRIQVFDPDGDFVAAWGADVITAGKDGDVAGTNPYEICIEAEDCKTGVATGGNGSTSGNGVLRHPTGIAVDGDTGNVYVTDHENRRINEYTSTGIFIASFGADVDATTAPTSYEVCPASDVCKAGVAGSGAGQLGSTFASAMVAVSQPDGSAGTGTVFVSDPANRRVLTYNLDGSSPDSFGSSAQFAANQPKQIAVDSRGIVYTSDSNEAERVNRYDSANANGVGVGFLNPIAGPADELQTITFTGFVGGNEYTLTCPNGETTEPIRYDSSVSGEQGRRDPRERLTEKCGASFLVYPPNSALTVVFQGTFAKTDVPQMTCTTVKGSGSCAVTTKVNGHDGPLQAGADGFSSNSSNSTSGLAVDPDSDGAGPDEDTLYVLRKFVDPDTDDRGPDEEVFKPTVVQQFGSINDPGLTAPPTAVDDAHGGGAAFGNVSGLGLDESSGRLFVSSRFGLSNFDGPHVWVIGDPLPPPVPVLNPITEKTDSTAILSATVDPNGGIGITCEYQYSTDQTNWFKVEEPDCVSLDPDGGPQEIEEEITGLDPNTQYFVRLEVTRALDTGSKTLSPSVKTFMTDSVPPTVADVGAVEVNDTSARLVGTINPRNSETGYVFLYGTTPALGSSTPPTAIGGGTAPITISQVVTGLNPNTTYYVKLAATNDFGITYGVTATFLTRTNPLPNPENRAWEQVTPVDKNYGDADSGYGLTRAGASLSGNQVGFCTSNQFGEPPGRMIGFCSTYFSHRTDEGWRTPNNTPPFCHIDTGTGRQEGAVSVFPSADYSRFVIMKSETEGCDTPLLDPAAPLSPGEFSFNLYRQDPSTDPIEYRLLNPATDTDHEDEFHSQMYVGGSDDFEHIVYMTQTNQTDPPDSPPPAYFKKLYDWHNGTLSLVSKDPSNVPFTTDSTFPTFGDVGFGNIALASAVSRDGSRIFFANPLPANSNPEATCETPGCEVYMREDGAVTYDVSASECTVSCGVPQTKADVFVSATPSGAHAFFISCAKLTDEASPEAECESPQLPEPGAGALGSKLYRWDRNGPPGHQLVDVTRDLEASDGSQPNFVGLLGASDDGDTVFFAARSQLVPGKPTAAGEKLYRWQWNGGSPTVDYLGLFETVSGHWSDMNYQQTARMVTPDGEDLMVFTPRRIIPAADGDDEVKDVDKDVDIYRWNATRGWACVSCQRPGVPSVGDVDMSQVWLEYYNFLFPEGGTLEPRIYMSDDGDHIFFGTPDALVPADTNGAGGCPKEAVSSNLGVNMYACEDVYEWHDGTLSLVSSGTSVEAVRIIGSTPSARDVFFYTRQQLVGWDIDDNVDIYDSRVGGGFPEPPAQPAVCEGEACRGPGTTPPSSSAGAGSAVFQGPGNPQTDESQARCPKGKRKVRRNGKDRCVAKHRKRTAKRNRRTSR